MTTTFDAIVIGGGSAGLAFAKEAASRGASILLVERDKLGGTCVNRGCVPKKMIWAVSDAMQTHAHLANQGIFAKTANLDFAKLAEVRSEKIADIVDSFATTLKDHGIVHVVGDAQLLGGGKIRVNDTIYSTDKIIIATGTRPSPLDIEGGSLMALSDDVFGWTAVPETLVVIGGGYIGCEMAAIFNGLGSDVTIVSNGPDVLTEFSEGAQQIAAANLKASGVELVLNNEPSQVTEEDGKLAVTLSDGRTLRATHVLNATGRQPNLGVFGEMDVPDQADSGALRIDAQFRTSQEGIYAIGDIADRLPLTPVAREDGETLAKQLFGLPDAQAKDLNLVATTAFVFPPIGEIGRTGDVTSVTKFTAMDEMIVENETDEGWALVRNTDGDLAGATIVGHAAAEAVSWAAQSVMAGLKRDQMNRAVAVHPSKAEEPLGSDE